MNRPYEKKILYLILCILFFVLGYGCHYVVSERESTTERLLNSISADAVEIELDDKNLQCEFVLGLHVKNFEYNIVLHSYANSYKKEVPVEFTHGVGSALFSNMSTGYFRVILEIRNGSESRYISLADKIFVNVEEGIVTHIEK